MLIKSSYLLTGHSALPHVLPLLLAQLVLESVPLPQY